jgi:XTP/dITP diphosphohydrolase
MDPRTRPLGELFVATGNEHKMAELRRLFPGFALRLPGELGRGGEFQETGRTYLDNALGKALHLYRRLGRPVLADDSGLEVPALGGQPGVYSSRYGAVDGRKLAAPERNALLLERAQGLEDRRCRFVCCMVVVLTEVRFLAVQETCEGVLAPAPRGEGGFGYDPVVWLPERDKTVAELGDREKDEVSHRGRAARRLRDLLAVELPKG